MKSVDLGGTAENWRPDSQDDDDPANGSSSRSVRLPHGRNDPRAACRSHGNDGARHLTSGGGRNSQWFESSFCFDLLFWK